MLDRRIAEIISPTVEDMGYELVRVIFVGKHTLQVMVERADRAGMTVEDCAAVSRAISAVMDVEDPIEGSYNLEVSSPGLDRPLVRFDDYRRFAGLDAKVELRRAVDGRRRFRGKLQGVEGDDIVLLLTEEEGEIGLSFREIDKAKLILTDELINEAKKKGLS